MPEKKSISGFLGNLFSFGDRKANKSSDSTGDSSAVSSAQNGDPLAQSTPVPMAGSNNALPTSSTKSARPIHQTEAYKNRRKGRKENRDSHGDLKRIISCIERHGEAKPAELAEELGMSRSTLAYNLKSLLAHRPEFDLRTLKVSETRKLYRMKAILGQKSLVKMGAGPNVRYRIDQGTPGGEGVTQ